MPDDHVCPFPPDAIKGVVFLCPECRQMWERREILPPPLGKHPGLEWVVTQGQTYGGRKWPPGIPRL